MEVLKLDEELAKFYVEERENRKESEAGGW